MYLRASIFWDVAQRSVYCIFCPVFLENVFPTLICVCVCVCIQQDATLHGLFISGNCSTCFGWYPPIIRNQEHIQLYVLLFNNTMFLYPHIHFISNLFLSITVWHVSNAVDTFVCAPDGGWRYHPKHVEQFPDINKLCNISSCWIYIRIYLQCTDPWTLNKKYFPYCYNPCTTCALCISNCMLGALAILRYNFLSTGIVFVLQQRRPLCGCYTDCQSTHHHAEFWEQTSWACGTHVPGGASPVFGGLQFIQWGRLRFWIREWVKQRRIWWWGISWTGGFYRGQHCPAD